jgi:hypothetical protein
LRLLEATARLAAGLLKPFVVVVAAAVAEDGAQAVTVAGARRHPLTVAAAAIASCPVSLPAAVGAERPVFARLLPSLPAR